MDRAPLVDADHQLVAAKGCPTLELVKPAAVMPVVLLPVDELNQNESGHQQEARTDPSCKRVVIVKAHDPKRQQNDGDKDLHSQEKLTERRAVEAVRKEIEHANSGTDDFLHFSGG